MAAQGDVEAEAELAEAPGLPPLAAHIWGWFLELARCRQYGGMGSPLPIGYRDILAWRDVTGAAPDPWELRAILALDGVWLDQTAREAAKDR